MSHSKGEDPALAAAKRQVAEVTDIMAENVKKALEREGNLDELGKRTSELEEGALQFKKGASTLKKKHMWENMKFKIAICVIIALIVIAIICAACTS